LTLLGEEPGDPDVELLGGESVEEGDERSGDSFEAHLRLCGAVAGDERVELFPVGDRRVHGDRPTKLTQHELQLDVVGLLTHHRAVVVEHRDALGRRDAVGPIEEREDRRSSGSLPPRGKDRVVHRCTAVTSW
jgi:hypothetical protein